MDSSAGKGLPADCKAFLYGAPITPGQISPKISDLLFILLAAIGSSLVLSCPV